MNDTPPHSSPTAAPDVADARSSLLDVVSTRAVVRFDEPRQLSSGKMSSVFIDAKAGLARGADLRLACRVIAESVSAAGIDFDAVGGLTLGADQFAHGIATVLDGDVEWFVIRKAAKGRGTNQLVEGARLTEGRRVLLVDDIVTTGGSIQQAYDRVVETGAAVVAAVTLLDRGDVASAYFAERGVPYLPVFTYRDVDIEPVTGDPVS